MTSGLIKSRGAFPCPCGRVFGSLSAMEQHRQAMAQSAPSRSCGTVPTTSRLTTPVARRYNSRTNDSWLFNNTAEQLCVIDSASVTESDAPVTSGGGYEVLCSYNWLNCRRPTIHSPGEAPRYTPKAVPMTVARDSGEHFIDQNKSRAPRYPFEMAFRAMEAMGSTAQFNDIDVLTNRNSLRKLLDFVSRSCGESFRMNLYAVANTLIIERCEKSVSQLIYGSSQSGFGHNFERAITQPPADMDEDTSYHRVLRYDLGTLRCAVQFEVDACYQEDQATQKAEVESSTNTHDHEIPSLLDAVNALHVKSPAPANTSQGNSSIEVVPRGKVMPQSQALEVKTWRKNRSIGTVMPQLWFGRTPWLIRGFHTEGTFDQISLEDVGSKFTAWETTHRNETGLRKMVQLLGQLRDTIQATDCKTGAAVFQRGATPATLQVFVAKAKRLPLPKDVIAKFWQTDHAGGH